MPLLKVLDRPYPSKRAQHNAPSGPQDGAKTARRAQIISAHPANTLAAEQFQEDMRAYAQEEKITSKDDSRKQWEKLGRWIIKISSNPNSDLANDGYQVARQLDCLRKLSATNGNLPLDFFEDLLKFPIKNDPDNLVGNRWLLRGSTALWAGGSGYGKSSLQMQLILYWVCGEIIFGLRPVRPLKILVLQAENNKGDLGEEAQGIWPEIAKIGDIDLARAENLIKENLTIPPQIVGISGDKFLALLDNQLLDKHHDLVFIDNLFAFAGCDLKDSEKTGKFLREGLFPIAVNRKTCINMIHHTPKAIKDSDLVASIADLDMQFMGFGSVEIPNSFRAVNVLARVPRSHVFKLVLSKRGDKAGAKTLTGERTSSIYLEQSREQIFWFQTELPDEPKNESKAAVQKLYVVEELIELLDEPLRSFQLLSRALKAGFKERTFWNLFAEGKASGEIISVGNRKWDRRSQ
jgi:hypothetical protein